MSICSPGGAKEDENNRETVCRPMLAWRMNVREKLDVEGNDKV